MTRKFILPLLVFLAAASALAQTAKRPLTIDDIFDRTKRIPAAAMAPKDFTWADGTHFFWLRDKKYVLVDATTGQETALFDANELEAQISKVEGVTSGDAKRLARPRSIVIDWGNRGILLLVQGDLYIYNIGTRSLTRLTSSAGDEQEATFSPDGKLVGFVRANNLFVIDIATKKERKLTTDGSAKILNGLFDWMYQEEIFGRGIFKGYWWSPDSRSIAFIRLDESKVPYFTVVDHIPAHQKIEATPYPLPGDPNPLATLHVADLASVSSKRIDRIEDPSKTLIVDVAWRPDSSAVVFQVQDREQTWLDLNETPRAGGDSRRLLRETTKAWVDNHGSPFFLRDGSFLWLSERTGWLHIYRVGADGQQRQLTSGEWEVKKIFGIDEKTGYAYYSSAERDPIGTDVYRMKLDGSDRQRLTERGGTHDATFNDSLTRLVDNWSDTTTPNQVFVAKADGQVAQLTFDMNEGRELDNFDLVKPELVHVPTRDGFIMDAVIFRPKNFDPAKKYPVYEDTYSGPHAPQVRNAWGGTTWLWHQMLAQKGVVVWVCDNRSASGKGAVSAWPAYKNLGALELRDLEDGVDWLASQPGIDRMRFLLNGWSYGGFMTTYALTHSTKWSAGIAGGSVTDWHQYDSVYTERLMLMPENNKEGYERSSPAKAAANLQAKLLLLHGAIDDNVHVQNTIQFSYALQKAGKPFEMMLYPKSRHGVLDADLVKHMRYLMLDFVMRSLTP
jgi:dipeptidyl-peptidase-4